MLMQVRVGLEVGHQGPGPAGAEEDEGLLTSLDPLSQRVG